MIDLIIRGGAVVDGTGRPPFTADIGVAGGRIGVVGSVAGRGRQELDAAGLTVAPGFIDIHSHSDFTLLIDPRAQSALAQGVTTELVGNCGHGCAPLRDMPAFRANIYGYGPELRLDWTTTADYLARLEEAGPAINIATLVPNGNLRLMAMERPDDRSTRHERLEMARLLETGLAAGAFGFSSGLEYAVEAGSTVAELIELCRIVGQRDGLYATHTRERDVAAIAGVEEAISVAGEGRVRLQVGHILPRPGAPDDALERMIGLLESMNAGRGEVAFDIHTRLFGLTNLSAILPSWALEGSAEAIARRLHEPSERRTIKGQISPLIASFGRAGWERVYLLDTLHRPDVAGRSVAELTPPGGDPLDVLLEVLAAEAEGDAVDRPMCICWSYEEAQIARGLASPLCGVASDATTLSRDGPLAGRRFHGAYTWAAWFLRRLVRERGELPLAEAIRRITSLPAAQLRLADRGTIREGNWADMVAFDPASIGENGTLEEPNQLAGGVRHVLVNGRLAVEEGRFTGARAGQVLRR